MPLTEYLSAPDAARLAGISRPRLYTLLVAGTIAGERAGGPAYKYGWRVERASLDAWITLRKGQPGRPRTAR